MSGALRAVAAGDFNSDGKLDLLVSKRYSVSVLLNSGACGAGAPVDAGADVRDAGGG